MASSAIFAILLLSNVLLVAASEQDLSNASLVDSESSLYANARVLGGIAVTGLLDRAQLLLASKTHDCRSALPAVYAALDGQSLSLGSNGVAVNATVAQVPANASSDDFALARPFDGGQAGSLNLMIHLTTDGHSPGGRVEYQTQEAHVVHLPVDLGTAVSFCLSAAEDVSSASLPPTENCSAGAVADSFAGLKERLAASAAGKGLAFSLTYTLDQQTCSVSFEVRVAQEGIAGPLGPFSWVVEEPGSVDL